MKRDKCMFGEKCKFDCISDCIGFKDKVSVSTKREEAIIIESRTDNTHTKP